MMNLKAICKGVMLVWVITNVPNALAESVSPKIISNPVVNYMEIRGFKRSDQIMKVEFDFDGDGRREVLISEPMALNGKAGNMWLIYTPVDKGYKRLDTIIDFRDDALYMGYVEELKGKAILSYWPSSAQSGTIMSIQIKGDQIIYEGFKDVEWENQQSKDILEYYFGLGKEPAVKSETSIQSGTIGELIAQRAKASSPIIDQYTAKVDAYTQAESYSETTPSQSMPSVSSSKSAKSVLEVKTPKQTAELEKKDSNWSIILIPSIVILFVGVLLLRRRRDKS